MISHRLTCSLGFTLLLIFLVQVNGQHRLLGGLEDEKPVDNEVREIVAKVNQEIQDKYPEKFESVEPLAYRTQMVAGKNYFVRSLIREKDGDKKYAHLRIYKSFRGPVELVSIRTNMEKSHPLSYF